MKKWWKHCTRCGRFMHKGIKQTYCVDGRCKPSRREQVEIIPNSDGTYKLLPLSAEALVPHYTQFKIQPITFITANKLNFCQGNIIKYILRYKEKNGLEDLKKAQTYLGYLIQETGIGEVKP